MAILAFRYNIPETTLDNPIFDDMPQACQANSEDNAWEILRNKARDFIQKIIHDTPANIDDLDKILIKGGCFDSNNSTVKYIFNSTVDGHDYSIESWAYGTDAWVYIDLQHYGTAIFDARVYA